MNILILGGGRMGGWLAEELCREHAVALYDLDQSKLKRFSGIRCFAEPAETEAFQPDLVINAVSISNIKKAFEDILPYIPADCLLSDIASVKTGLRELYNGLGKKFVSTHPMFGPTFADIRDLRNENAIIIQESDATGKAFFRDFYQSLRLNVFEYTFDLHDETIAYSLSIPFASSMVFAAVMKQQEAPGTTFKKHLDIAKGLFAEDDQLLAEVMFNPYTVRQIEAIASSLAYLTHIIRGRDYEEMHKYINRLRDNIT